MTHCIPYLAAGLVLSLPVGAPARPAASEGSSAEFERARTLYRQGQYPAALAALESHRRALPPGARLSRWSLDFAGHAVPVVLTGTRHLYYATDASRDDPAPPLGA